MTEIQRAFCALKNNGDLGAERLFLGSKNQTPQLLLKGKTGLVRARRTRRLPVVLSRGEDVDDGEKPIQKTNRDHRLPFSAGRASR